MIFITPEILQGLKGLTRAYDKRTPAGLQRPRIQALETDLALLMPDGCNYTSSELIAFIFEITHFCEDLAPRYERERYLKGRD